MIVNGDPSCGEIDVGDFLVDPGVDSSTAELVRGPHLQIVEVLDPAPHVVGLTAGRVADMTGLLEDDDLQLLVGAHPAGLAGRRHPRRVAPDHHQALGHQRLRLVSDWARRRCSSSRSPRIRRFLLRMIRPIISSMTMAARAVTSITMINGASIFQK